MINRRGVSFSVLSRVILLLNVQKHIIMDTMTGTRFVEIICYFLSNLENVT